MIELEEQVWVACKALRFSDREVQVAELLARGYDNRRIANELSIEPVTVKSHFKRICHRLEIQSTNGMVRRVVTVDKLRSMGLGRKQV